MPNTLQEMMLISHQGTLRIFPVWPRQRLPDAAFFGLRARGGFIVAAELANGEVRRVQVDCPAGGPLRVANPWPGRAMSVNGESFEGELYERETRPGERVGLEKRE